MSLRHGLPLTELPRKAKYIWRTVRYILLTQVIVWVVCYKDFQIFLMETHFYLTRI